jgi:hypothetical protein
MESVATQKEFNRTINAQGLAMEIVYFDAQFALQKDGDAQRVKMQGFIKSGHFDGRIEALCHARKSIWLCQWYADAFSKSVEPIALDFHHARERSA